MGTSSRRRSANCPSRRLLFVATSPPGSMAASFAGITPSKSLMVRVRDKAQIGTTPPQRNEMAIGMVRNGSAAVEGDHHRSSGAVSQDLIASPITDDTPVVDGQRRDGAALPI